MKDSKYVMGLIEAVGDKAIYLNVKEYEDGNGRVIKTKRRAMHWFPRSQILSSDDFVMDAKVELEVPLWLMKRRGFVEDGEVSDE